MIVMLTHESYFLQTFKTIENMSALKIELPVPS